IFHLVLARPEGHGPGTKGLSMFLVPKYLVDADGNPGERNGAEVTNLEHKMGLKASATCELTFGARRPAVGTLVGDVHDGIRQMFMIIEHARMMVGTKAIATLSTGYLNALDYARSRVQGADLTRITDKTAPRVTIAQHPDVRRMLMMQKAYAEGMRALALYTATFQDTLAVAGAMSGYVMASLERPPEIYRAGLNTTRLLMAIGDLVIGWLLGRQGEVALAALDAGGLSAADRAFYTGKVATAQFFAQTVLP